MPRRTPGSGPQSLDTHCSTWSSQLTNSFSFSRFLPFCSCVCLFSFSRSLSQRLGGTRNHLSQLSSVSFLALLPVRAACFVAHSFSTESGSQGGSFDEHPTDD